MCRKTIRNFTLVVFILGFVTILESIGQAKEGSLVLWYSFQGAGQDVAEDLSGNGNDGVIVGAKRVNGKFGKGVSIGMQDEYIEIANVLQPECTIEFWFKPNWGGGDNGSFRLFDANTADIYYMIGKGKTVGDRENTFGFYLEDAADADFQDWQVPAADFIKAGEWHHIATTWSFPDGIATFYINGEAVSEVKGLGDFPPLNPKPKIGFNVGTNYMPAANGADSVIDELAIYSEVLDADAIKTDMNTLTLAVEPADKLPLIWGKIKSHR